MALVIPSTAGTRSRRHAVLDELIEQQERALLARTPASARLTREASAARSPAASRRAGRPRRRMPSGSATASGSHVVDVDGTEYVDLHAGFGAMLVGHAHPAVVRAVQERVDAAARTSRSRPTTSIVGRRASWRVASTCRCGASATRAPRRRWTRSTSCAPRPAARGSSRSKARTTVTTTRCRCRCIPTSTTPAPTVAPALRAAEHAAIPRDDRAPHGRRAVRRPRSGRARVLRVPRRDRRHDHRADDDEHRRHRAARRLPRRACATSATRHGAFLAFDEVKTGLRDRARRHDRALRRRPRHRLPGQGARRRAAVRRDRRHRRDHAPHRGRQLRAGRHVQRQPAHDGRGPRHAARGAHARRVRGASTRCARSMVRGANDVLRALRPARLRERARRQGLRRVLRRRRCATTATSSTTTRDGATRTGCSSTTAACSCRRGASASSGRSRCSTPSTTSTGSSTTSRRSRVALRGTR